MLSIPTRAARTGFQNGAMKVSDKLSLWGGLHAAARDAERKAAQQAGGSCEDLRLEARRLREQADRLHREVYSALGSGRKHEHAS